MGLSYIGLSAVCTILSYVTLHMWTESSVSKLNSEGLIHEDYVHAGNVGRVFELLLGSNGTIALLANFVLNVFVLLVLVLKVSIYPDSCHAVLISLHIQTYIQRFDYLTFMNDIYLIALYDNACSCVNFRLSVGFSLNLLYLMMPMLVKEFPRAYKEFLLLVL